MSKIISKRGKSAVPVMEPRTLIPDEMQIHIYSGSGSIDPLTDEEQEHIKKVFDKIRKQLSDIVTAELIYPRL